MRYAIVAAALIASVAAVPFNRHEGPWGGRPGHDPDCEVSWVTVDPEPTASSEAMNAPTPTTASSVEISPVDVSSAETTRTRRPHWGHGPHPAKTTAEPETTTTKSTHKPKTTHEPTTTHAPKPTTEPQTTWSTSAVPSTTPEPTQEPTSAGSTPFPYPSPTPTQMTWTGEVNSAAHGTSYSYTYPTDFSTTTTEAACTAAASAYVSAALDSHNTKRAEHRANPVVWDDGLSCVAQRQAESCLFEHLTYVNGGGYGQNIAEGIDSSLAIGDAIDLWYAEQSDYAALYGEATPDSTAVLHFTQLVWASTTSIGCATHSCDGSVGTVTGDLLVCNYWIEGNMAGAYASNVLLPTNATLS